MPGNTIRKVYVCRAKIRTLRPGDLLFFYMSKDDAYAASQSMTTVGVFEQAQDAVSTHDLVRLTAKRSVFSNEDLENFEATERSPVRVIDFLLSGHIEPAVGLDKLVQAEIFNSHPPQSIANIPEDRYRRLVPFIWLGFEL